MHHLAQRENCAVPNKKLFGTMVHHMSLSKTLLSTLITCVHVCMDAILGKLHCTCKSRCKQTVCKTKERNNTCSD